MKRLEGDEAREEWDEDTGKACGLEGTLKWPTMWKSGIDMCIYDQIR